MNPHRRANGDAEIPGTGSASGFRFCAAGEPANVVIATSTVAIVAIAAVAIVALIALMYVVPRGGRKRRPRI